MPVSRLKNIQDQAVEDGGMHAVEYIGFLCNFSHIYLQILELNDFHDHQRARGSIFPSGLKSLYEQKSRLAIAKQVYHWSIHLDYDPNAMFLVDPCSSPFAT